MSCVCVYVCRGVGRCDLVGGRRLLVDAFALQPELHEHLQQADEVVLEPSLALKLGRHVSVRVDNREGAVPAEHKQTNKQTNKQKRQEQKQTEKDRQRNQYGVIY